MDWDKIPMNRTEKITPHLGELCVKERQRLMDFIEKHKVSVGVQAECKLDCFKCHPFKVIACYEANKKHLAPRIPRIVESNIPVAGVTHIKDVQGILAKMAGDEMMELVKEPENKFDPNAIKVMLDDKHLGYIPKDIAAKLQKYDVLIAILKWVGQRNGIYGMRIDVLTMEYEQIAYEGD